MGVIALPYKPRAWQAQVHRRLKRFSVLALHRRAGKTVLALMVLVHRALKHAKAWAGRFAYIAPLLKQAKALSWDLLKTQLRPLIDANMCAVNESELKVTFHNGSVLRLYGADNPEALRGIGLDYVVLDEVADIKPDVWESILRPTLADHIGGALFIGTPKGVNLFSQLFFAAQRDPEWMWARYTVYETNALAPAEVESQRLSMSEARFAREFLCDFSAGGDDQLVSLSVVEAAARLEYPEREWISSPRVLGIDVARFGDDRSVLFRRQGLHAFPPRAFNGVDNMTLAAIAANVIAEWRPDATFVDSGAGAGVIDRLRQLGHDTIEVGFGHKALHPEAYKDRRAEMWFGLREWLERGGSIPNDPVLKLELATPTYWYDPEGRKVLESKDDIKKRLQGGASPDLGDGLALTFAAPVAALSDYEREKRKWEAIRQARDDADVLDAVEDNVNPAGRIGRAARRGYDPYKGI